jgi:hypothetical protein
VGLRHKCLVVYAASGDVSLVAIPILLEDQGLHLRVDVQETFDRLAVERLLYNGVRL